MAERKCIVIAWTEESQVIDPTAPPARRDQGERPKMMPVVVPKAVTWLLKGSGADIKKAREYAVLEGEGRRVFVYPVDERDPLGRAKQDIIRPPGRGKRRR